MYSSQKIINSYLRSLNLNEDISRGLWQVAHIPMYIIIKPNIILVGGESVHPCARPLLSYRRLVFHVLCQHGLVLQIFRVLFNHLRRGFEDRGLVYEYLVFLFYLAVQWTMTVIYLVLLTIKYIFWFIISTLFANPFSTASANARYSCLSGYWPTVRNFPPQNPSESEPMTRIWN